MTLALLIMAAGGAWAQSSLNVVELEAPADWETDNNPVTAADLPGFKASTLEEAKTWTGAPSTGSAGLIYAFDGDAAYYLAFNNGAAGEVAKNVLPKKVVFGSKSDLKTYYTAEPTEWSLTPDETGKKWTLDKMPASDIELQVEYFAESNLFLSKEALADAANIAVTAGDLGVQFGDDGKSANTVTEGTPMTVTYNGTKKLLGMTVEKKEAAAPTITVTWNSSDFYFDENPYTKDGVTLTPSNDMAASGNNLYQFGDNTFTTTLGKFIKIEIEFESTTYSFDGWTKGTGEQYQPDTQTYPDWWENLVKLTWTGDAESVTIKGKDVFGIHSITFTIQ